MKQAKTTLLGVSIIMLMMAAVIPAVILNAARAVEAEGVEPPAEERALALAQKAAARGYRELVLSPGAWNGVQLGTAPHGFDLDAVYDDVPAGRYAVRLASGPLPGQVTITGVARERRSGLVRSVRVVYDYFPNSSLREADCSWDAAPSCP
jgi:hypothetical protein